MTLRYGIRLHCMHCGWQGIFANLINEQWCPNCLSDRLVLDEADEA